MDELAQHRRKKIRERSSKAHAEAQNAHERAELAHEQAADLHARAEELQAQHVTESREKGDAVAAERAQRLAAKERGLVEKEEQQADEQRRAKAESSGQD